jgi:hypothetical protein
VGLVLSACAFFADEVEERVDQEGDGCVEGFRWGVAACEDLEDVGRAASAFPREPLDPLVLYALVRVAVAGCNGLRAAVSRR